MDGPILMRGEEEEEGESTWLNKGRIILSFLFMVAIAFAFLLRRKFKSREWRRKINKELRDNEKANKHKHHASYHNASNLTKAKSESNRKSLFDEIQNKLKSDLSQLAVHIDFPRLCNKMNLIHYDPPFNRTPYTEITLHRCQNLTIHSDLSSTNETTNKTTLSTSSTNKTTLSNSSTSIARCMKDILATCSHHLSQPGVEKIEKQFIKAVSGRAHRDMGKDLLEFLSTSPFGDEHATVKILKACNQSTLAPAVIRMKVDISSQYPYKDKRGSWSIHIIFVRHPPPAIIKREKTKSDISNITYTTITAVEDKQGKKKRKPGVSEIVVVHSKQEISWRGEAEPQNHFEFQWLFSMYFDGKMKKLRKVDLRISNIYYNPKMSQSQRSKINAVLAPYIETCDIDYD